MFVFNVENSTIVDLQADEGELFWDEGRYTCIVCFIFSETCFLYLLNVLMADYDVDDLENIDVEIPKNVPHSGIVIH